MFAHASVVIPCDSELDQAIENVSSSPAVFLIQTRGGSPYIGRAGDLKRRLARLLRLREQPGRLLNLRGLAEQVEYWPVGSRLESSLVYYELAKQYVPDEYLRLLKLRMPSQIRLSLGNPFPRTQVTARISTGLAYGPFKTRALAEQFEHGILELFQLRRCQEDLQPSPEHPGCIYGEMNMCLRPCQTVVNIEEYASEAGRVAEFLRTNGRISLRSAEAARDRLSEELDFEGAARMHKRVERIEEVLRFRDELTGPVERLAGIAVTPAAPRGCVSLWFFMKGGWQRPVLFPVSNDQGTSTDRRLKTILAEMVFTEVPTHDRPEHLALLASWHYSTWCDGTWVGFETPDKIPYRRLVSAISKAVHQAPPTASD